MLTCGVSTRVPVEALVPNRPRAICGDEAPLNCTSVQPAFEAAGNFDSSVPAVFDPILNQPESENESVRSKLNADELARLAHVVPSKLMLPSISPGCCWLANADP